MWNYKYFELISERQSNITYTIDWLISILAYHHHMWLLLITFNHFLSFWSPTTVPDAGLAKAVSSDQPIGNVWSQLPIGNKCSQLRIGNSPMLSPAGCSNQASGNTGRYCLKCALEHDLIKNWNIYSNMQLLLITTPFLFSICFVTVCVMWKSKVKWRGVPVK